MRVRIIAIAFLILISLTSSWPQAAPDGAPRTEGPQGTSVTQAAGPQSPVEKAVDTIQQGRPTLRISGAKIFWTIVVFLLGLLTIRTITRLINTLAERWSHKRFTIKAVVPMVRIFGWTFVIYLIIADVFAPPIETLIAVTASAGIAIGFASQEILKNIFGGIMILFDRPFQIGDKIEVGKYYGEVVRIGLRTVRVVTPDDSLVSVPNSVIVSQSVSCANAGESNCQVVAEFYLPPEIDLILAKKIAYRAAAVSRYVYLNKPIVVLFMNEIHMGRSLLKMRLKAYVLDLRLEFPFKSEMTETVVNEYLKQGLVTAEQLSLLPAKGR
jgi:small-conductance mechanosensitive channel